MMWYGDGMGAWGYVLMITSSVLFWALVILGIVALFRYLGRSPLRDEPRRARPTAEQLLDERFARGEIDEDEYRQRLNALRSRTHPMAPS